jgi:hypothetical protein
MDVTLDQEHGLVTYAASPRALSRQAQTAVSELQLDLCRTTTMPWTSRSKLDLLVALLRIGWGACDGPHLLPHTPGSAKGFVSSGIRASKWYFIAMLSVEDIFSKGFESVPHQMPGAYYQILCEGTDEQIQTLLAIPDVRMCSLKHFQPILADLPMPELDDVPGLPVLDPGRPEQEPRQDDDAGDGAAHDAPEPEEPGLGLQAPAPMPQQGYV